VCLRALSGLHLLGDGVNRLLESLVHPSLRAEPDIFYRTRVLIGLLLTINALLLAANIVNMVGGMPEASRTVGISLCTGLMAGNSAFNPGYYSRHYSERWYPPIAGLAVADGADIDQSRMLTSFICIAAVSVVALIFERTSSNLKRERDIEHQKALALAETDVLTGLANRRSFDAQLCSISRSRDGCRCIEARGGCGDVCCQA